ncbi:MAG: hypothetical protein ACOY16_05950 [Chloroflexota bacterium]
MIFFRIVGAAGEELLGEYPQLALGGKEVLTGGFKVKVISGRQHYAWYKLRLVSNTSSRESKAKYIQFIAHISYD